MFSLRFKRNESFRFEFGEPVACEFKIVTAKTESNPGNGGILDISPKGLKLFISFNLPIEKKLKVQITFTLNESPLTINGFPIWKKKAVSGGFLYGIQLENSKDVEKQLIEELKQFAKRET